LLSLFDLIHGLVNDHGLENTAISRVKYTTFLNNLGYYKD